MFAKLFLHADNVKTHSVFASDLVAGRELVDLLILVKTLVLIAFHWAA